MTTPRLLSVLTAVACTTAALAQTPPSETATQLPPPTRLTLSITVDGVYSTDGAWIAFASSRDSNDVDSLDIYRMDANGQRVRRLTTDAANDEMPAISPDGKRIAFMSARTGNPEIYVMNSDGSQVQRLTEDPGWDIHPRWSPDGRRVLFNSTRGSVNLEEPELFELYVVQPDGKGLVQLTHDKAVSTYASYSPDGARIVYRRIVDGNSEIFVMNADGSQKTNLTVNAAFDGWPIWSPDGRHIAFASNRARPEAVYEIYVIRPDGTGLSQLTSLGFRSTAPEFSRDSRSILFTRAGGGFADLYQVPVVD